MCARVSYLSRKLLFIIWMLVLWKSGRTSAGASPRAPPPLLPHPPNPTAITHLLYATKFHVLVEENSIRTSRWKCSCKLAWSSQNSGEGERDFTLSRAVIPTLNNAYSPSPSASCGQLHARPHSLTSASLCIIVYYTDIWRAKFSMKAQHFF